MIPINPEAIGDPEQTPVVYLGEEGGRVLGIRQRPTPPGRSKTMGEMPTFDIDEIFPPEPPGWRALADIEKERARQDAKWGQQNHDDHPANANNWLNAFAETAEAWKRRNADRVADLNAQGATSDRNCHWDGILLEEVFEAVAEDDPKLLRAELVQVAAVAAAWIECIDRRAAAHLSTDRPEQPEG